MTQIAVASAVNGEIPSREKLDSLYVSSLPAVKSLSKTIFPQLILVPSTQVQVQLESKGGDEEEKRLELIARNNAAISKQCREVAFEAWKLDERLSLFIGCQEYRLKLLA